jgi:hypothetical protein
MLHGWSIRDLPFLVIGTFNGMEIPVSMTIDDCMVCCGPIEPLRKRILKGLPRVAWPVRGKLKIDGDFFFVHFIFFAWLEARAAYGGLFFGTGSTC